MFVQIEKIGFKTTYPERHSGGQEKFDFFGHQVLNFRVI